MSDYSILPFNFKRFSDKVLITSIVGDYYFLSENQFRNFVDHSIQIDSKLFDDLKSKFFILSSKNSTPIDILATRYRSSHQFLYDKTSLHMFVVTYRCNQKCLYCHASSSDDDNKADNDMDEVTAKNAVEYAFQSPSQNIKIEFQGGEPLLNFKIIKLIVEYSKEVNVKFNKNVEFVLCTNLTALKAKHLDYIKKENIGISTSLDGPKKLHNSCRRLRDGSGSFDHLLPNLNWVINELGRNTISALLTVSKYNLPYLKDVINEYISLGIPYIFIRELNPFGYAIENYDLHYTIQSFLSQYIKAIEYIFDINKSGTYFPEIYLTILLSRILTPYSTGFMDLQSPSGAGLNGMIYDNNGDVYLSDEGRMHYRSTSNKTFCVGNVNSDSWRENFCSKKFGKIISKSWLDSTPGCAWCAYLPYCGADVVKNYIYTGHYSNSIDSRSCKKHLALFNYIFNCLYNCDDLTEDVIWSWLTGRPLDRLYKED